MYFVGQFTISIYECTAPSKIECNLTIYHATNEPCRIKLNNTHIFLQISERSNNMQQHLRMYSSIQTECYLTIYHAANAQNRIEFNNTHLLLQLSEWFFLLRLEANEEILDDLLPVTFLLFWLPIMFLLNNSYLTFHI
jgi:hypothetical protein